QEQELANFISKRLHLINLNNMMLAKPCIMCERASAMDSERLNRYGGPLINIPPERFNATAVSSSRTETNTDASLILRVATPYGGFDKTPRGITFKLPEVDLNAPRYPELQDPAAKRPIFNRTAQGWISNGTPLILPSVSLEPFEIPESDDL
uniref:Myozenin 2b n=1 Tax=Sinocyclocheilus grahami TaxID=75366 RepID=A0A672KM91_SINGR